MRTPHSRAGRGLIGFMAGLLFGMSALSAARAAEITATVAWFQEQEAGIEPYPVRYIVTPEFLRSDDGVDDGDFLLFDRRQRRIYTVVRGNRTALEIDAAGAPPQKPGSLQLTLSEGSDEKAPEIAGAPPLEIRLLAGDELCRTALVAPGFLEPVRAALQEFSLSLAVQQVRTLANTPAEFQTPCFLARYLYATDFHLARGMLLADWDETGERRELTRYEADVPVDAALFVVPRDYTLIPAKGE
jgi:hypothetical protein